MYGCAVDEWIDCTFPENLPCHVRTKASTLWQNPLMNGCTDSRLEGFMKRANEGSSLNIGASEILFPEQ